MRFKYLNQGSGDLVRSLPLGVSDIVFDLLSSAQTQRGASRRTAGSRFRVLALFGSSFPIPHPIFLSNTESLNHITEEWTQAW